ncbi:putative clavaminate synthase-like protein, partial [Rhizoctonia solani 123E]
FPADNKQVFELYWSRPQMLARSHHSLLKTTQAVLSLFKAGPKDEVSLSTPLSYADRLRIRLPGDTTFALGPHIDGGSLERWEDIEYRKCYTEILTGNWRNHDSFKIAPRLNAKSDLYRGPSQCSALRGFQGWLALSDTGPNEGTLRTYPLLRESVAYVIMRPFFRPIKPILTNSPSLDDLSPSNWVMDLEGTDFPGAVPGSRQELNAITHPHLMLDKGGMVSMRSVRPGDMVLWHCDGIHAVESKHAGQGDSSVFYIPAVPLTAHNAEYLATQRGTLISGYPAPDFPGGTGESMFVGAQRGSVENVKGSLAKQAMGLGKFDVSEGMREGEKKVLEQANVALGFQVI